MSKDLNSVSLIGRLTRDAELKQVGDKNLLSFSIAINGYKKDDVSFFQFELWGKQGEAIAQWMTKGKQVAVKGELKQKRWQAQDNSTREQVLIIANSVQLLGSSNASNNQQSSGNVQGDNNGTQDTTFGDSNDDIPF